ncbi:polysaccharide biosynthesis protein [Ilyomonas limi]|uniref:Polysaccharide biosynthesis protein n=1 Tax=Ilyomonas limi TaxID=2575867 RepID=A0A4U3L9D7_9BACT|nr:polysaccharide biosynthesis protein [Ilyomonas limi]TKK70327.1 polysaccharide biosynthesis protein [Ilyomonas limi]
MLKEMQIQTNQESKALKYSFTVLQKANKLLNKGHARSIKAKKNILISFLVKGISIAISFILVPLTISYVNASQYGIWLTLSSIIAWVSFFDIGFTQGLRNKFGAAKAHSNILLARIYVSTTYCCLALIFSILWIFLISINQVINWHSLLNIPAAMEGEVSRLATIVFSYFCFQFVFRIINTILIADQKPAMASFLDMLGQLLSLAIIFVLTRFGNGSLLRLGLAVGIGPTLILILSNFFLFKTKYKNYRPSIALIRREYAKDIMTIGLKFFLINVVAIVQYESSLFLIAHYFDTVQVTAYNIAYKYFSSLHMVFTILISPLWSGVTNAYNCGDIVWVKNVVKKYLLILIPFILLGAVMLVFANTVYELWIGKNVVIIKSSISLLCYIFFATGMFASIFVSVLNGIGALKVQFITAIFTSTAFLLVSLTLIKQYHTGVESILIASIVANVYGYIIAPLQYYNIFIRKSKASIWYK